MPGDQKDTPPGVLRDLQEEKLRSVISLVPVEPLEESGRDCLPQLEVLHQGRHPYWAAPACSRSDTHATAVSYTDRECAPEGYYDTEHQRWMDGKSNSQGIPIPFPDALLCDSPIDLTPLGLSDSKADDRYTSSRTLRHRQELLGSAVLYLESLDFLLEAGYDEYENAMVLWLPQSERAPARRHVQGASSLTRFADLVGSLRRDGTDEKRQRARSMDNGNTDQQH